MLLIILENHWHLEESKNLSKENFVTILLMQKFKEMLNCVE